MLIADNDATGGADQVTRAYDELDRLTLETTSAGTVGYQFDPAGRRIKLSVSGQSDVFYCYDNADRLTSMRTADSCGGSTLVGFGYDNADRRTTLDLPNGTQLVYGYDEASQLKTMTWYRSGNPIGDLAYDYDDAGRRVKMWGSYARLNLPAAQSTTIYDANNRLTKWGNKTISYDNNGNMLGDLNNSYTWNARDQLTAVTKAGQTLPSFTYDPFGRRLTKTLGSTVTTYRYDGANTVQEKQGTGVTASVLTGLGVDEVFQRTEGATVRSFITDALGSTLALADTAGAIQTSYTYAPYGETTVTGATSANTSQFTGRENDSDGLYYYRARYYHPVFGRFISEDPIGFGGGDPDLYAYTGGSPVMFSDPTGQIIPLLPFAGACATGAMFSVATELVLNSLSGRKNTLASAALTAASGCISGVVGMGVGMIAFRAAEAYRIASILREISPNFVGRIHRVVLKSDVIAHRYWGGPSAEFGHWLTTSRTVAKIVSTGESPLTALNLPIGATAEHLTSFVIPKGTEIFVGRVAGGIRWATQIWIKNPGVLR